MLSEAFLVIQEAAARLGHENKAQSWKSTLEINLLNSLKQLEQVTAEEFKLLELPIGLHQAIRGVLKDQQCSHAGAEKLVCKSEPPTNGAEPNPPPPLKSEPDQPKQPEAKQSQPESEPEAKPVAAEPEPSKPSTAPRNVCFFIYLYHISVCFHN